MAALTLTLGTPFGLCVFGDALQHARNARFVALLRTALGWQHMAACCAHACFADRQSCSAYCCSSLGQAKGGAKVADELHMLRKTPAQTESCKRHRCSILLGATKFVLQHTFPKS